MPKILIVEEDTGLRDTIALNLRSEGYQVHAAAEAIRSSELPGEFAFQLESAASVVQRQQPVEDDRRHS